MLSSEGQKNHTDNRFTVLYRVCILPLYKFFKYDSIDPLNLIPQNAIYILEAEDPIDNWETFSSSTFWTFLGQHPYMQDLDEDAAYLDSLIQSNRKLFRYFGDRHFILSAHMTLEKDYDFLWGFDLENASSLELTPTILKYALDEEEFALRKRTFEDHEILEIEDLQSRDILYIAQVANYLMFSYTSSLVENCIKSHETAELAGNIKFREVYREMETKGLCRWYVQHEYFDNFLNVYIKANEGLLNALGSDLEFSGFDLGLNESEIQISGFSNLPDASKNYLEVIRQHGNAKITADKILSNRTAFLQGVGIDDVSGFYEDMEKLGAVEEADALKADIEKRLHLSLKKDFLSWFGSEIVLAYNRPSNLHFREDDLVLAVRTKDLDDARDHLENIQKQIKKHSPAKFKSMNYKSYQIHYLDLKGVFKVFFGKIFDRIDKPYYTIIEEFVVFSNSPKTLVALLEDYENNQVLASSSGYLHTKEQVDDDAAIFSYVNGPLSYPVFSRFVQNAQLNDYRKNEKYFKFFQHVGISFKSKSNGFEGKMYLQFSEKETDIAPPRNIDSLYSEYFIDLEDELKNLGESERFVLEKVQAGKYTRFYPNSDDILLVAETKNGVLHGRYLRSIIKVVNLR